MAPRVAVSGGLGIASLTQLVPFQNIATRLLKSPVTPTAVQAELAVHDTLASRPPPGTAWAVQVLPFQVADSEPPTAMHDVPELHFTA